MTTTNDATQWGAPVRYLTDDRDVASRHELVIQRGGNGDWYVSVIPAGQRMATPHVRLSTSGGAASACPGLTVAISNAYRAMRDASPRSGPREGGEPTMTTTKHIANEHGDCVAWCPACRVERAAPSPCSGPREGGETMADVIAQLRAEGYTVLTPEDRESAPPARAAGMSADVTHFAKALEAVEDAANEAIAGSTSDRIRLAAIVGTIVRRAFARRSPPSPATTTLLDEIEAAIKLASELGSDAFDAVEGRGLYHMRLAIKAALSSPSPATTGAEP